VERQIFKLKDLEHKPDVKEVMADRYKLKNGIYARIKNGVLVIVGEGKVLSVYILEQIVQMFKDKMKTQKKKQPVKLNIFYYVA